MGIPIPVIEPKKPVRVLSKLRQMDIIIMSHHKRLGVDISILVNQELIYFIV